MRRNTLRYFHPRSASQSHDAGMMVTSVTMPRGNHRANQLLLRAERGWRTHLPHRDDRAWLR